jgi:hypothetical protein
MRFHRKSITSILFLSFLYCLPAPQAEAVKLVERPLAFMHVNVLPMTGDGVWDDQIVVVEKGRIARVGPAASVWPPSNALLIDGRGKYLNERCSLPWRPIQVSPIGVARFSLSGDCAL